MSDVRTQRSALAVAHAYTLVPNAFPTEDAAMMPPNITIEYLANHPELADELARLSWTEWQSLYEQRGETFSDSLRKYRERINIDRLPLALVALAGAELVGTVSLKHNDLDIRPELNPWAACLSFRNGGGAV